jgi:pimeloyl-ACP methyl ester carboxylesterase
MATPSMTTTTRSACRDAARAAASLVGLLLLAACTSPPLMPFSTQGPPLVLVPATQAGVVDQRARFREIFCAVLEARKESIEDYRPCDEALTRLGSEPSSGTTGRPVELGASRRRLVAMVVPGVGYECFEPWLQPPGTAQRHLAQFGYDLSLLKVDPLSGTARNARMIRDALMAMPAPEGSPRIVLVGYSKGTPDILEALVTYPEIRGRVAAMVSVAGAVGGSPLANDATQDQANLIKHFPGSSCDTGDNGAVEALRPQVRSAWLAQNPTLPPQQMRYFSLVTLPQPERVSLILRGSRNKLAQIDERNDSQVIFYDQVVPGSGLLGYLNADHWAIAVPLNRTRAAIAATVVTQNAYPREALIEAVLRFVEEEMPSGHVEPGGPAPK